MSSSTKIGNLISSESQIQELGVRNVEDRLDTPVALCYNRRSPDGDSPPRTLTNEPFKRFRL